MLRHLIRLKLSKLDEFIKSVTALSQFSEYEYHHISSEILLLEKQYKQAYKHLPYIDYDESIQRFEKVLYNYSPYQFEKLLNQRNTIYQLFPVR